jgi:hypothetical protein
MITFHVLLRIVLAPVIVSAAVAGLGRWRRWAWAMPLAGGAGFLAGYAMIFAHLSSDALVGVPRLPPRDGTDWLFWLAIPAIALGVLDALVGKRWGWALGAAAGVMAWVVMAPLVPHAVSTTELAIAAAAFAAAGAGLASCARRAEPRVTSAAVVAVWCVTLGAAGIVVLSSNLQIVGFYGIAASAALGPVAAFAGKMPRVGRSVAVTSVLILAGLLVGGRYYPAPGVTWVNLVVLTAAPALLLLGAAIPGKRDWARGVAAVTAVALAVAAVTAPTALAAKKAAEATEDDPYAAYR